MARNVVETLSDLIMLDKDAVSAYDKAIAACDLDLIRSKLAEFKGDHERHIQELSSLLTSTGVAPRSGRDVTGYLMDGFTAILSRNDHSALFAMRGDEELTNNRYHHALGEELPLEVRVVVERNYEDEKRHLGWIKDALEKKLWKAEKAA